jgi:hypothetical protein
VIDAEARVRVCGEAEEVLLEGIDSSSARNVLYNRKSWGGTGAGGPATVSSASWSGERCHGDLDGWSAGDREAVFVGAPRQGRGMATKLKTLRFFKDP